MGKITKQEKKALFGTKTHKKCPRCGKKCPINQTRCDECDLLFERLKFASNKLAKEKIRKFDTDFVIYTNQYPSDVSWLKLLLLTFLTGLVGGQYYYVGKYWKGVLMSCGFALLLFGTIFNAQIIKNQYVSVPMYFVVGVYGIAWIVSLVRVGFKRFRVPILVPTQTIEYSRDELKAREKWDKTHKKPEFVVIETKDHEKKETGETSNVASEKSDTKENK